jgi:peptidyl-tRNA hydrolase, PTH1 family
MAFVIVGLGNPGEAYRNTRHNAGRMAVEHIAKHGDFEPFALKKTASALVSMGTIDGEKVTLVLPEVAMNLSGKVMPHFIKSVKAAKQLIVLRDELDLPLGVVKMTTYGRGSGGHKGVESIMRALKTKEFAQIKIGISGQTPKGKLKKVSGEERVVSHVIGKFKPTEEAVLKKVLKKAAEGAELFVSEGIEKAMLETNTR